MAMANLRRSCIASPPPLNHLRLLLPLLLVFCAWQAAECQPIHWTAGSMPRARSGGSAARFGDLILFVGGIDKNGLVGAVDVCNVTDFSWSTAAGMPNTRGYMAVATLGDIALFGGGATTYPNYITDVNIYNATSKSWRSSSGLSVGRDSPAAASSVQHGMAFFAGGHYVSSLVAYETDAVDVYFARNDSWRAIGPLSAARRDLAATCLGDLVFFAGGQNTGGITDTIDIYNISSGGWTTRQLSQPRTRLAAVTVNGTHAIFAGGTNGGYSAAVDIYNSTSDSWHTTSLSLARADLVATSVADVAIFAGGVTSTDTAVVVDMYNVTTGTWSATTLATKRSSLMAASTADTALIAGGGVVAGDLSINATSAMDIASLRTTPSPSPSSSPTPSNTPTPSPTCSTSPSPSPTCSTSPSASPSPSRSGTPSPVVPPSVIASNTSDIASVPILELSLNSSDVMLIPKDGRNNARVDKAIKVRFGASLREVNPDGDTVKEHSIVHQDGWRRVELSDDTLNATASFIFTGLIGTSDPESSSANTTRVEIQFYLFENRTDIALTSNSSVSAEPTFAKFTVRIFNWTWDHSSDTLEMRLSISPSFSGFTSRREEPQSGLTTLVLEKQFAGQEDNAERASTVVRLIDTVELDGRPVTDGQGVRFDLDVARSELVLSFSYFSSSLAYDPDLGVLFTSQSASGGDSVPVGLIIGVATGVTASVVIVVLVIGGVLLVAALRRRNARLRNAALRGDVNFSYDDSLSGSRAFEMEQRHRSLSRSLPSSSPRNSTYHV